MYTFLTKSKGRIGRISAQSLDSTYKKDRGRYSPSTVPSRTEQAWLISDLLHDWNYMYQKIFKSYLAGSFETVPGPKRREYWIGIGAVQEVIDFSYGPSIWTNLVVK